MTGLVHLLKLLLRQLRGVAWWVLCTVVIVHSFLAWLGMRWAGEEKLIDPVTWMYYYMVTATSVGYGDFSPQSPAGRLIATFWLLPVGVALFASFIGKTSTVIFDFWRRGMMGKLAYAELHGHTILIGWHGDASERMVDLLLADTTTDDEGIVLCVTDSIENPLPDKLKFVRGDSFHSGALLERAGLAGAARVLVYGHNDEENFATAMVILKRAPAAQVVVHFSDGEMANLLKAHYPLVECTTTLAVEMLVRAAQDPGTSAVTHELLSIGVGPTQFALALSRSFPGVRYGVLFDRLKSRHNATLLGIADDRAGGGLKLNAPSDVVVHAGQVLFYMADQRIDADHVLNCLKDA
jgi:voltage-gated potassium channel